MKLSTNKKCRYVICGTILLCIFVLVGLIGYRFLLHEKVQNNRISALEGEILLWRLKLENFTGFLY